MKLEKTRDFWNVIYAETIATGKADLFNFVAGAMENAAETDGVAFESDAYFLVCFDSLESLLAYSEDTESHEFFASHGVRF